MSEPGICEVRCVCGAVSELPMAQVQRQLVDHERFLFSCPTCGVVNESRLSAVQRVAEELRRIEAEGRGFRPYVSPTSDKIGPERPLLSERYPEHFRPRGPALTPDDLLDFMLGLQSTDLLAIVALDG